MDRDADESDAPSPISTLTDHLHTHKRTHEKRTINVKCAVILTLKVSI